MRRGDAVEEHVLSIASAVYVGEVGSDGIVQPAGVSTAMTVLQDNSLSAWSPALVNARR